MTSDQATLRVQKLAERNANALSLARLLSFAALAEPALIRQMRLDLLNPSSAADEADLWFSNLVQSRSPGGLVFFPEVADILRRGLTPELRREAWERTRHMHRFERRAIRIEEELTYLGLDPEANRTRIEELLHNVISALVGGRRELANWAARAVPRLPSPVLDLESASVLRIAADLRLGRDPNLRARLATVSRMPPWIAAVLPALKRVRLAVTLANGELSLGPIVPDPVSPLPYSIEVPDMPTVAVEVKWTGTDGPRSKILFVEKGEISQRERVDAGPVELVTLANEAWTLQPTGTSRERKPVAPLAISAYTDGNAVTIHWRAQEKISGCLGFALMRRRRSANSGGAPEVEEVLPSRLGFADSPSSGALSTKDPHQRFAWIDRPTRDVEFSYRVVPMVGWPGNLLPMEALASSWSAFVCVGQQTDAPISVAFNRTLENPASLGLSPQDIGLLSQKGFQDVIAQPGSPVRQALGGDLLSSLTTLLRQAQVGSMTVYVAMFELDDPEILHLLEQMGKRANILLSNGAARPQRPDSNLDARLQLKRSGVHVLDRMLPPGRLAHNKFLVICDSNGQPSAVWTGNVSWVSAALCARSNAAVTLNSPRVAAAYLEYWQRLAISPKTSELMAGNGVNATFQEGSAIVHPWFTPIRDLADIETAARFVANARQGILFLLSEPGRNDSLIQTILEQENLHILGATRSGPSLTLHRNRRQTRLSGKQLSFPLFDVAGGVKSPRLPLGSSLQSRMIVIDPLGSHPVVLIGSHGFGERGSSKNDENFLIVENDSELAHRCAAHIEAYCQHYRFRANTAAASSRLSLRSDDSWQASWFELEARRESAFWMAEDSRTFTVQVPAASAPESKPKQPAEKPALKKQPKPAVHRKSSTSKRVPPPKRKK